MALLEQDQGGAACGAKGALWRILQAAGDAGRLRLDRDRFGDPQLALVPDKPEDRHGALRLKGESEDGLECLIALAPGGGDTGRVDSIEALGSEDVAC